MKYVGARYMPNFVGAYDISTNYEALTVVDNGMGTSYVSNKPVPAGTPLTNTDYWAVYGSSSGAIINLQNQIGSLSLLKTIDKDNLVDAINELDNAIAFSTPEVYGAVGDGVTDDTQAIQECVDNNNFVILNGNYLISNKITLHSNLNIMGTGSIINPTEFLTSLEAEDSENIVISGITFVNGSKSGSGYTSINANILFNNCDNVTVDGIIDKQHNKMASILLYKTTNFIIRNCNIIDSGYSGVMCYGQCHYGKIVNNIVKVSDYTGYANTYGIGLTCYDLDNGQGKTYECSYITIDSNVVYTTLAHWEGIDTHACNHIFITNNLVKGFYVGIRLTRTNGYTDTPVSGPTYCTVSNNKIHGVNSTSELSNVRSEIIGIAINGNATQSNYCDVCNNEISGMQVTIAGVNVGYGIEIGAHGCNVSNNVFKRYCELCILINNAGGIILDHNTGMAPARDFIKVGNIDNEVLITNNSLQNGRNFYNMTECNNINYIIRENNSISNSWWQGDTASVTDVSAFVPDVVNTDPSSSPYHRKGAITRNATPTSNQPLGWVADNSTWLAMANLT